MYKVLHKGYKEKLTKRNIIGFCLLQSSLIIKCIGIPIL
ncbi:MAG: hypothetical protein JETT_3076 [Candidatus Jettenia ecosi]|uniref:Uncharacterized protein n=1 Tax=Candidatus Jettenia ecosi TaxID=2494326 RepID=A0A533Q7S5_9BACT|nr:MAG: hypothetical protein JETT_3076 [Candidatus Jettenia ecosi]